MSKGKEIENFILSKIKFFEVSETRGNINAELARLRRGVGKSPGEMPELYGLFLRDMPESFWTKHGSTTAEEWSCYTALTLYAVHQQGNLIRVKNMHTDGNVSLGTALRQMVLKNADAQKDSNAEDRMIQKLQMLITSKDIKEFAYHLRNIIKLLKNNGVAMNYARLASDIYKFQFLESRDAISLSWGQDFFKRIKEDKNNE